MILNVKCQHGTIAVIGREMMGDPFDGPPLQSEQARLDPIRRCAVFCPPEASVFLLSFGGTFWFKVLHRQDGYRLRAAAFVSVSHIIESLSEDTT